MLLFIGAWALLSLAYLLLVGQASADELGLTIVCGLGAAIWSVAIRKVAVLRFRFEPTAAAVMMGPSPNCRALSRRSPPPLSASDPASWFGNPLFGARSRSGRCRPTGCRAAGIVIDPG